MRKLCTGLDKKMPGNLDKIRLLGIGVNGVI